MKRSGMLALVVVFLMIWGRGPEEKAKTMTELVRCVEAEIGRWQFPAANEPSGAQLSLRFELNER